MTAGAHILALGNTAVEDEAKTAAAACFIGYSCTKSLEWEGGWTSVAGPTYTPQPVPKVDRDR